MANSTFGVYFVTKMKAPNNYSTTAFHKKQQQAGGQRQPLTRTERVIF